MAILLYDHVYTVNNDDCIFLLEGDVVGFKDNFNVFEQILVQFRLI